MKDELETNLASEEAAKLNETNTPVETPEVTAEAAVVESDNAEENAAGKLTKEEILTDYRLWSMLRLKRSEAKLSRLNRLIIRSVEMKWTN